MYGGNVPTSVNAGLPATGAAAGMAGWFWLAMALIMLGMVLMAASRLMPRRQV